MSTQSTIKQYFGLDRQTIIFLLIMVLFIGSNFYFLANQFVYNEYIHANVGYDLFSESTEHLDKFYERSASPHTIFIFSGVFYKIMQNDTIAARSYMFLIGILFLLMLMLFINDLFDSKLALLSMFLLSIHPMFVVYSKYMVADVPFVFFASTALLFFYYAREKSKKNILWKYDLSGAIFLGLAFLTKYNTAILYPIIGIYLLIIFKFTLKDLFKLNWGKIIPIAKITALYTSISFAMVLPMMHWIRSRYVYLVPAKWHDSLFYEAYKFIVPQFSSYVMWVGLFAGVATIFFVYDLYKRLSKFKTFSCTKRNLMYLALYLIFHTALFYFIGDQLNPLGFRGEMNVGWLENIVPMQLLHIAFYFILLAGEIIVANFILMLFTDDSSFNKFMSLWVIISLIIMSLTRPANRYLMLIFVPLVTMTARIIMHMYQERKIFTMDAKKVTIALTVLHIVIFLALAIASNIYLMKLGITQNPVIPSVSH